MRANLMFAFIGMFFGFGFSAVWFFHMRDFRDKVKFAIDDGIRFWRKRKNNLFDEVFSPNLEYELQTLRIVIFGEALKEEENNVGIH